jgi:hypothetical protein
MALAARRVVELCRKGFGGKLSLPTNERHDDRRNSRMNIRRAVQSDVSRIMQIRHLVRENRLSAGTASDLLRGKGSKSIRRTSRK